MDRYLNWFFSFMSTMLGDGLWRMISNFFLGLVQIFNFPVYFEQMGRYSQEFNVLEWIAAILSLIFVYGIWFLLVFLLVLVIRKYIRFRRSIVSNDDLLEELADLHRDVLRLTKEKERILAMKIGGSGITMDQINQIIADAKSDVEAELGETSKPAAAPTAVAESPKQNDGVAQSSQDGNSRFYRLTGVDAKYEFYVAPQYNTEMSLEQICDDFRNFCCSRMHLYYEKRTIRLMFAGLAATKMILLQGISGTGKTSLPYALGKYLSNDATIASVQPSWRDRSELFGYFNEFAKKFNETEVLKRIYEASFNDDINIIVLDEMNIARVEYYFADMLSVLEMPDPSEWKLELVPSVWQNDPKHLTEGKLSIPQNVWYIGTANNDDSTFAVSDKVYDRAQVINLDSKGIAFDAPDTPPKFISYSYIDSLYDSALAQNSLSREYLEKIGRLDMYIIQKFRVAFGNRIMKQLQIFVPVYIACGGAELDAIDYMLSTKVFRKFESLNLSLIRDEISGLINFLDTLFGKGEMKDCISYLERLKKTY